MKIKYILVMGVGLIFLAGGVYAFGPGGVIPSTGSGTINSAVKDVGKMVVVSETNKKLAGKAASCVCNTGTGEVTGLDYAGIKNTVDSAKDGLQIAFNRNANFNVKAGAQGCASTIQSNVTGWWYWRTAVDSGLGSSCKLWLD